MWPFWLMIMCYFAESESVEVKAAETLMENQSVNKKRRKNRNGENFAFGVETNMFKVSTQYNKGANSVF